MAVPIFAFLAAGVHLGGIGGLVAALTDPVARFTRAHLDEDLAWVDVLGVAILAGIGFTVSLLIGELAFGAGTEREGHVNVAVLTGSVLSATLAGVLLRIRNRTHRRIDEASRSQSLIGVAPSPVPTAGDGRVGRALRWRG